MPQQGETRRTTRTAQTASTASKAHPALRRSKHETKQTERCPYCGARDIIKKGVRKNKYGAVQLFYCHRCAKKFSPLVNKHKSFPLRIILDAITRYDRLFSLEESAKAASRKYGIAVSRQTLRNWLSGFKEYLPFARMHGAILRRYDRRKLFLESQLFHGQVYAFKYHRAKTDLIVERGTNASLLRPLQQFLERVPRECPHRLFREERGRASTHKPHFDLSGVPIIPKHNMAVKSARFVLQAVANNRLRHETLQEYLLVDDSATVAVEVPITLSDKDIAYFERTLGFVAPFTLRGGVITGHIDFVQIRDGMIQILDYKPNAKKVKGAIGLRENS